MKRVLICTVVVLAGFAVQAGSMAAVAQEQTKVTSTSRGAAEATKSGIADGASSPDEMGNRRPPYRIRNSDVIEIKFNFVSEFDQTVSVQPDGFIALRDTDELYAEGLTVAQLRSAVHQAYLTTLHDPEVTITLKDFEKPYFIATGAVAHPGKYELRSAPATTWWRRAKPVNAAMEESSGMSSRKDAMRDPPAPRCCWRPRRTCTNGCEVMRAAWTAFSCPAVL